MDAGRANRRTFVRVKQRQMSPQKIRGGNRIRLTDHISWALGDTLQRHPTPSGSGQELGINQLLSNGLLVSMRKNRRE